MAQEEPALSEDIKDLFSVQDTPLLSVSSGEETDKLPQITVSADHEVEENLVPVEQKPSFSQNSGQKAAAINPSGASGVNAIQFDIAGVLLRMSYRQVQAVLRKNGYTVEKEEIHIPKILKWNYDYECREQGTVGFEAIQDCIESKAVENGLYYTQALKLKNFTTGEKIDVYFTTPLTQNVVYKIDYKSAPAQKNHAETTERTQYQKERELLGFWERTYIKYGQPSEQVAGKQIWRYGENAPYLEAGQGQLVLHNEVLEAQDLLSVKDYAHNRFRNFLWNSQSYSF